MQNPLFIETSCIACWAVPGLDGSGTDQGLLVGFGAGLTIRSRWDAIGAGPPSYSGWPYFCILNWACQLEAELLLHMQSTSSGYKEGGSPSHAFFLLCFLVLVNSGMPFVFFSLLYITSWS